MPHCRPAIRQSYKIEASTQSGSGFAAIACGQRICEETPSISRCVISQRTRRAVSRKPCATAPDTICNRIVSHREHLVQIYNDRLDRWQTESLGDLANTVPLAWHWEETFTHAHQTRLAHLRVECFAMRLPDADHTPLWSLLVEEPDLKRQLILITNVPLVDEQVAQSVYSDWRERPRIEHTYRSDPEPLDQERGLGVEDMCVHTLERMRRLFVLVLLAALFTYHIAENWPRQAVLWLRHLGGKLGL